MGHRRQTHWTDGSTKADGSRRQEKGGESKDTRESEAHLLRQHQQQQYRSDETRYYSGQEYDSVPRCIKRPHGDYIPGRSGIILSAEVGSHQGGICARRSQDR